MGKTKESAPGKSLKKLYTNNIPKLFYPLETTKERMIPLRTSTINRRTNETDISLTLSLDGGASEISTGLGFFDHMLAQLARHGVFGIALKCLGDLEVDGHHTVEDVGLALGEALRSALGDKRGIERYGQAIIPMDEALILCAVDLSGRPCLRYTAEIPAERVGGFDTELVREFMQALCSSGMFALHIRQLDGLNSHHIIEGMFKALARALKAAVAVTGGELPSTKGVL